VDEAESTDPPELHEAASFGMPMSVVEERIRAAADIDVLWWWGRTPLFEAVMNRECNPRRARRPATASRPVTTNRRT
jgi:hypothetical protein